MSHDSVRLAKLVELHWGPGGLAGAPVAHHGRCRGQQRRPRLLVECGAQEAGGRTATRDLRVSFPTGTSKWNKVEHRLLPFIGQNWRGKPLITHEVIVKLIVSTPATADLRVRSRLYTESGHAPGVALVRFAEHPGNAGEGEPARGPAKNAVS